MAQLLKLESTAAPRLQDYLSGQGSDESLIRVYKHPHGFRGANGLESCHKLGIDKHKVSGVLK